MVSVLIGGILVLVVVVGVLAAAALRRRSQDEVHSVEHYHRSMHTLEEMRRHPSHPSGNGQSAYPAPAFRTETPTVRPADPNRLSVPPSPPPPLTSPGEPITFDDDALQAEEEPEPAQAPGSTKGQSRAMQALNRPRRRLAAPMAAVGAVTILVVVLVLSGLHTTAPHHGKASARTPARAPAREPVRPAHRNQGTRQTTTTTTAPPVVSAPGAATNQSATYQVAVASYSLAFSVTSGECWVHATDASGAVLFTGILQAGQSQTVPATGPVTVVAGAPSVFAATVNGAPVALPPGPVAPFTLNFVSATAPASA
jgi:cytoskeletal protein RodZ